jgi:hypothetical protein
MLLVSCFFALAVNEKSASAGGSAVGLSTHVFGPRVHQILYINWERSSFHLTAAEQNEPSITVVPLPPKELLPTSSTPPFHDPTKASIGTHFAQYISSARMMDRLRYGPNTASMYMKRIGERPIGVPSDITPRLAIELFEQKGYSLYWQSVEQFGHGRDLVYAIREQVGLPTWMNAYLSPQGGSCLYFIEPSLIPG